MFYDPNDRDPWARENAAYSNQEYETLVDIFNDRINMSYDSNYIYGSQNSEQEFNVFDENAPKPIKPYQLEVVGLLEPKSYNEDMSIFIDLDVLKKLMDDGDKSRQQQNQEWGWYSAVKGTQEQGYETAYVKVDSLDNTQEVCDTIKEMGFYAYYDAEYLVTMQESARNNQNFLAAIGAVSLLVAAIGIANTMIMSIYERTREIGVMKVIGAAIRDIKWMFLLESALIGFLGGILGVGLSYLVSYIINNMDIALFQESFSYIGDPDSPVSVITLWLCGLALGFAAVIGLVSGYFPARRAMRLSALTAIRTE
jgi:ABC-type antimicrobial peptide transport system permease subunit